MQLCLWQNCLYALLTSTTLFCSMFGINYAWLFLINYLPQRCHKLSKAGHNNYVAAFQKLSKVWNWQLSKLATAGILCQHCSCFGSGIIWLHGRWGWWICKTLAGEEPKREYIDIFPQLPIGTQSVIWLYHTFFLSSFFDCLHKIIFDII